MSEDGFKLPGASLDEIEKIIEAFSKKSGPASNDEIAKLVGSATSTISRCNGFLVSVGLIKGGQKKESTELGRKLGLALHHRQEAEARRFWNEVVTGNEFLSEQVTSVRVQKAIPADELPPKILYNSGSSKNKYTETGARTVTDILVRAGFLSEGDGTYTVSKGTSPPKAVTAPADAENVDTGEKKQDLAPRERPRSAATTDFQLAVNLQIQIQEFEDTSKYEDLFRAMREHLLTPPGSEER